MPGFTNGKIEQMFKKCILFKVRNHRFMIISNYLVKIKKNVFENQIKSKKNDIEIEWSDK